MKKTTVRFAVVGTVLLLGAVAMALAQHDARERPHDATPSVKLASETPQPILVDDVEPTWMAAGEGHLSSSARPTHSSHLSDSAVAANDERGLAAPPSLNYTPDEAGSSNPLRPLASLRATADMAAPLGAVEDGSAVEQAAGEGPPSLAALPTLPPALGAAPLAESNSPPTAAPPTIAELPSSAGLSSSAGLPSGSGLPTGPIHANSAPPGWVNSGPAGTSQSLSDTQRPAMATTNLSPEPRAGGQPWLQAPVAVPGASAQSAAAAEMGVAPKTNADSSPNGGSALDSADFSPPGNAPFMPPSALLSSGPNSLPDQPRSPLPPSATLGLPQPAGVPVANHAPGTASSSTAPSSVASSRGPLASNNARSLLAGSALGSLVSNQPGNRHLDGSQNPIMLIQKRMAGECQVGKRTTVVITVRNAGNSAAQDVEVVDSVPSGAIFAESIPAVTPTAEGVLVWPLGEMAPGDERTINLQIIPERQGELGSTAVVRFAAQASVRTLATLPKLELTQSSAPEVLIGSPHAIDVVVKNVGTGVARGVRLEADLPANVRHESGDASLEASFGELAPNESKHIRLDSMAIEPGPGVCAIRALTEDGLQQAQKIDLRVLAPVLEASIVGPSKRYLDRQATFEVMIKNAGTASATNCEFAVHLPSGLNFNTANKAGTYDPKQHTVFWSVPEFPAGHAESVELTVLPVEVGPQALMFQGSADLGVKTEARGGLTVEEQGELSFRIEQDADPIEVTSSTTFTCVS